MFRQKTESKSSFFLLTVDLEDWFQVENFKQCIPFSSWSERELRVENNTYRLLDLFDSIKLNNPISPTNPKATFFVLGWLAERFPNLIKEIHNRGHEVASHGYCHDLCIESSYSELKKDLIESKILLEDIIGDRVYGYRAPSFSINDDILKIIEDCGYLYDSSYNSFGFHSRYGKLNIAHTKKKGIAIQFPKSSNPTNPTNATNPSNSINNFYELPISNLRLSLNSIIPFNPSSPKNPIKYKDYIFPWGGGGYFRLFPFLLFKLGVRSILNKDSTYMFYIHPWEIDVDQPRVKDASAIFKFRHYVHLKKTQSKLEKLIMAFSHCSFVSCRQYLKEIVV
jgi:polysaccharide deacetylase family protein (PEP-CTERM system associated)